MVRTHMVPLVFNDDVTENKSNQIHFEVFKDIISALNQLNAAVYCIVYHKTEKY